MIETLKVSLLTMILTAWSTMVMAQTSPGGTPGTPGGGTTSPSGTTTGADPAATGGGMDWIWIIVAVVVVAALLFYFFGRGRSTRV